jgi:HEAT repeat protein
VEPLLEVLADTTLNPWRREGVIAALGQLGDVRAFEALCRVLDETPTKLRVAAAKALD